ncbi:MAG: hypothetical protein KatS3mg085_494 [Candidatus Dojkabacteria bacterium]|nr:MAG: hypothetical protein KatS3mg085_494 [Candidatus Dojkabacteria bacterium]
MVETVRIIVIWDGKVLLLKKAKNSNNPDMLELPGGKIEDQPLQSAIRELEEETSISLSEDSLNKLSYEKVYTFDYHGVKTTRIVYYYYAFLNEKPSVSINGTTDIDGKPEDKHQSYEWVDISELQYLQTLAENSKIDIYLLRNLS